MGKRTRQPGLGDGNEGRDDKDRPPQTPKSTMKKPAASKSSSATKQSTIRGKTSMSSIATSKTVKLPSVRVVQNKIIVGVDYGTTASGAAFVMSVNSDERDVQVILDWPGATRETLEKVPSKIAYAMENAIESDQWGCEPAPTLKSYTWTKLLLNENATATEFDHPRLSKIGTGMMELPEGKESQDVAADFLSHMYQHIIEKLTRVLSKEILATTPIEFWLTVPAQWQEEANDSTREAAITAGFQNRPDDQLFMITEPEAAAIAILTSGMERFKSLLKIGTNVLVADLGGGTLDFQCLTITAVEPLKTEQACHGDGGKSGSVYIDLNLLDWCEQIFGGAFNQVPSSKTAAGSVFMEDWEMVKKTFTGRDLKKTYPLRLPALAKILKTDDMSSTNYDFDEFAVLVSDADIEQFFKPIVHRALKLVKSQAEQLASESLKSFQVITLCGGLGSSVYVWKCFEEFIAEELNGEVVLMTDDRAQSSVVRGAAIRGLEGSMVLSRRARRYYGIGVHQAFKDGIDKEEDAFECPLGGKRATGYIDWAVKKGMRFTEDFRAPSKVYVPVEEGEDDLVFFWDLYSCATDKAPVRVDELGVEHQAKIKIDLTKSFGPKYKSPKKKKDGTAAEARTSQDPVHINIVFKLGAKTGILNVEAMKGRTCVGTAKIDYAKTHKKRNARSAGLR